MRNVFHGLIGAAIVACASLPTARNAIASPDSARSTSDTSFYEVALMCPAAAGLGCGSKAKPILLSLEKMPVVAEAWLDRPGRTLAIVWEQRSTPTDRATALTDVSKEHEVSVVEIEGKDQGAVAESFRSGAGWHRGADVDRLSEEEAGVIANRLLARVEKSLPASAARVEAFKPTLTDSIRRLLVETPGSSRAQWRDELLTTARGHLSEPETAALRDAMALGFRAVGDEQ